MLTITISPDTQITTTEGFIQCSQLQQGTLLFDPSSKLTFKVLSISQTHSNYSLIQLPKLPPLIISQNSLILTDLGDTRAQDVCYRCLVFTPIGRFRPILVRHIDEVKPMISLSYEPVGYILCSGIYCRGSNA